jgi:ribosomal protein S3AE
MAEQQIKKRDMRAFYEVAVPLTSVPVKLYGASPEALAGTMVKLDLSRSLRGKSMELNVRTRLVSGKLIGVPHSLHLFQSYVRKLVRKGTNYVEDSFVVSTKEGSLLIKPFLVTRRKVSRSLQGALRQQAREFLKATATIKSVNELFADVMANKLQRDLSVKLKKIYPLAACEIRVLQVVADSPSTA